MEDFEPDQSGEADCGESGCSGLQVTGAVSNFIVFASLVSNRTVKPTIVVTSLRMKINKTPCTGQYILLLVNQAR